MKYDPNKPLTAEEVDKLGKDDFDAFLEYLDSMQEYKQKNFKEKVRAAKKKKHDMLKESGVKNVKTHRSQWFD